MNFDIKTEQVDGAYVIALAGEVDLYTAPEFKQQLLDVIAKGGKEVIVDFSDTTFIDSTTLGVLVGGVKRLRTNDGQLSLVCSDRNITKIFEITGLDRVFTIYPTRAEALERDVIARARALGLESIFVLTTRTMHWFIKRGFAPGFLRGGKPCSLGCGFATRGLSPGLFSKRVELCGPVVCLLDRSRTPGDIALCLLCSGLELRHLLPCRICVRTTLLRGAF